MSDGLSAILVVRLDRMIAIESVIEDNGRGKRSSEVQQTETQYEDDPVRFVVRTESYHQQTPHDDHSRRPHEFESHFGFESSSCQSSLSHAVCVADVSPEYSAVTRMGAIGSATSRLLVGWS